MERITSCLMLAANLEAPVSFTSVFDSEDLKDTGIEFDSHVTVLFAKDRMLEKGELMKNIETAWWNSNPRFDVMEKLRKEKSQEEYAVPVFDIFDLGSFENDSGYVVLKMKPKCEWYDILSTLNSGLMHIYGIKSEFATYTPHLTLAEVKPGLTEKYVTNETLRLVLRDSVVHFEDFIVSYDTGDKSYKVHDLTHNHSVDRFFRIRDLKSEEEDL